MAAHARGGGEQPSGATHVDREELEPQRWSTAPSPSSSVFFYYKSSDDLYCLAANLCRLHHHTDSGWVCSSASFMVLIMALLNDGEWRL